MSRKDFILAIAGSVSMQTALTARGVTLVGAMKLEEKPKVSEIEMLALLENYGFERLELVLDDSPPVPPLDRMVTEKVFAIEAYNYDEDIFRLLHAKNIEIPTIIKRFPRLPVVPIHKHKYQHFYRSRPRSHL